MQLALPLGDSKLPMVRDLLRVCFGPQHDVERHNPEDQFIKAMLSSCTYDAKSEAAFLKLRLRIPRWDDLLDIPPHEIEMLVADVTRSTSSRRSPSACQAIHPSPSR